MFEQISNNGVILAFNRTDGRRQTTGIKKRKKSLLVWLPVPIFKHYCLTVIRKISYFFTLKKVSLENNLQIFEKLQMTDILIANAELSAFTIGMDDTTSKFLRETEYKQDEVLKLKEVNEERLRMVVQL
jgi:hypothetical protein